MLGVIPSCCTRSAIDMVPAACSEEARQAGNEDARKAARRRGAASWSGGWHPINCGALRLAPHHQAALLTYER